MTDAITPDHLPCICANATLREADAYCPACKLERWYIENEYRRSLMYRNGPPEVVMSSGHTGRVEVVALDETAGMQNCSAEPYAPQPGAALEPLSRGCGTPPKEPLSMRIVYALPVVFVVAVLASALAGIVWLVSLGLAKIIQ